MGGLRLTAVDLNFAAIAPLVTVAVAALLVLVLDLVLPADRSRPWWFAVSVGGLLLALWYVRSLWGGAAAPGVFEGTLTRGITAFGGAFILDRFTLIFTAIVLVAALLSILISALRSERDLSGYLALILWSALGMAVLAGAGNLLTLFLGLEILSLSLYVIVAFREGERSREAAFKYLILGSVASGAFLYGTALVYAQTGGMALESLALGWTSGGALMKVGFGLVVAAFAFKLALAPFHVWAPDVYEGAAAPVTAFMSVGTKAAAFAGLVRFLAAALPEQSGVLMLPLWILAIVSMVVGSVGACAQTNVKRLLAYSGVAHVGYLMMALLGLNNDGISAGVFYLAAYLFVNIGAFAVVVWLGEGGREGEELSDFAGLFYRRPALAGAMTLFLLSLAGLPPTGGFPGKLFLVYSALRSGAGSPASWLVAALVITTAVSAFAYLRVVTAMFRRGVAQTGREAQGEAAAEAAVARDEAAAAPGARSGFSWALAAAVALSVIGTVYLGVWPKSVLQLAGQLLPLS